MHLKENNFSSCQYAIRVFHSLWVNEKLLHWKIFTAPKEFDVRIADAGLLCLGGTQFYTGYIQPTATLSAASNMLDTACVNGKKLGDNFRRAHLCENENIENTFSQISVAITLCPKVPLAL